MASADVIVTSTSACAVGVFVFGSGQPIAGGALTSYDGEAVIDGDDYHTTNNENEKCTTYWLLLLVSVLSVLGRLLLPRPELFIVLSSLPALLVVNIVAIER